MTTTTTQSAGDTAALRPIGGIDTVYHLLADTDNGDDYRRIPGMEQLALRGSELYLGEVPISTACWDKDFVTWTQEFEGHFSAGVLRFLDDGLTVSGDISIGTSADDAVRLSVHGTLPPPAVYDTRITVSPHAKGTDPKTVPADQWTTGRVLRLSSDYDDSGTIYAKIELTDAKGEFQELSNSTQSIEGNNFVVTISTSSEECSALIESDPGFYREAELKFPIAEQYGKGVGAVRATCGTAAATDKVWLWEATPRRVPEQRADNLPIRGVPQVVLSALTTQVDDDVQMGVYSGLAVENLVTLTPPDAIDGGKDVVSELINDKLMRNMKWAMGRQEPEKGWLKDFLLTSAPTLNTEQEALAKKGEAFYREFGCAYLTKSFNQHSGCTVKLSQQQALKLDNYFSAGIAQKPEFNIQHQGLYREAYLAVRPKLQDYIADDGNAWAQKALQRLTTGTNFTQLFNSYHIQTARDAALRVIKKNGLLLATLDPTGATAKTYYERVTAVLVGKTSADARSGDINLVKDWLPNALKVYLEKIKDGTIQLDTMSAIEAKAALEFLAKNEMAVVGDIAQLIVSHGNVANRFDQAKAVEGSWANTIGKKYPKLAMAGKLSFPLLWVGSVYQTVTALTKADWKSMTTQERAKAVISATELGLQAFKAVKDAYKGTAHIARKLGVLSKLSGWFGKIEALEGIGALAAQITKAKDWITPAAKALEPLLKQVGKGTMFEVLFAKSVLSGVMKILGAAVAVALTVVAFVDLLDAIKNGRPIDTLWASLNFAVAFLGAVVAIASLFVAGLALPIIGFVLAIAGIVMAIIQWFTTTPRNPMDDFMKNHGKPFVDALPDPKQDAHKSDTKTLLGTAGS
ncbi:hypothetical protein SAMN05216188_13074 [Lentzea xinjiangensis]|uniref:Uncharacterized protein n=1 Tax=Lentzea xinjiangensis TaxID=402600 RepID=A0A1H9W4C0_9PSEU|nr:hypothetical protein [Lentzea xinjiangensis]SES28786.1 hypothetical protein SAMN05216188_13074 [Lentzea xinjiangensis]